MTDREQYEPCTIHLQKGDVITSKLGIVQKTIDGKHYMKVFRMKYHGNGHWVRLGERMELLEDVKEYSTDGDGKR